ncbi:hypothetical protein [Cerasicoccus arenae]|uniref:Uncharacterized protein n=1 Tax=Cerasicoccus arenae TaxID=424488 RepID=A0A8J3DDB7_9BACT|nr:hypothetical protein [Cerasicoccus arenae]MBK1858534.1 hypothetical protein [Cerasicoccus arenae]GHC06146.1 hypothetical protein GCM10007047_24010 [Cerasicoccus arenae]
MKFPRTSFALIALATFSLVTLDATPRRLSNLGGTNNLTDKKFDTGDFSNPRSDEMFGAGSDRIKFGEWHGTYSTLGDKKVNSLKQRGGKEFSTKDVEFDTVERQEAHISLDSDKRKMASVQNWNRVRDNVMSHKFSGTELNTPDARKFSEMVDEVSLRDVNRYQFWQNKTDDGIPVQVAGSNSGPQLSDEQRRVMARIQGSESTVTDYKEQGAQNINQTSSFKKSEPSFIESLFDW